jgi:hypothetical protein
MVNGGVLIMLKMNSSAAKLLSKATQMRMIEARRFQKLASSLVRPNPQRQTPERSLSQDLGQITSNFQFERCGR